MDLEGRTIWIVDAHGYGRHFVVRADEILTAFAELERAIHEFAVLAPLHPTVDDGYAGLFGPALIMLLLDSIRQLKSDKLDWNDAGDVHDRVL